MKRKIKIFIGDIIDNIRLAQRVTADIDYDAFVSKDEKKYTVVRCMEIIGEAIKNLPVEFRRKYQLSSLIKVITAVQISF